MLRDWIGKIRFFISSNPRRAKLITFIILLATIPITVFAALTIQNLLQFGYGRDETVLIVDENGRSISRTSDPQVFLKITLPEDWIAYSSTTQSSSLIEKTYAQSSCPTITCGTNSGAGGICVYGDPVEGKNSNVSGCTATCPNGKKVSGFSVSVCQTNNCYYNDCTCYPNPGACDSVSTPTPISTPIPVSTPTPTSRAPFAPVVNIDCNSSGYSSDICGGNPFGAGGVCTYGSSTDVSLPCTKTCPDGTKVTGISVSSCQSNGCFYNDCTCYATCGVGGSTPTPSATPVPQRVLKNLYIANNDTDGSTGGSESLNITSGFDSYLNKPIPWKLNPLLEGQDEAFRVVQMTLFDGSTFVPYVATVNLVRPTQHTGTISTIAVSFMCNLSQISQDSVCHGSALAYDNANFPIFDGVTYEWGISSVESIGTLEKTQGNITGFVAKNVGTGSVWVIARQGDRQEKKASEVTVVPSGKISAPSLPSTSTSGNINDVINQFGRRGANLSGDVNHDGIVDGIDYNILLRNESITP